MNAKFRLNVVLSDGREAAFQVETTDFDSLDPYHPVFKKTADLLMEGALEAVRDARPNR